MDMGLNPPGTNGDTGSLCYVHGDGRLGYKYGTAQAGSLIFKSDYQPIEASMSVAMKWYAPCKDLDILAYWVSKPENTVGWGQAGRNYVNIGYRLSWDGDDTGVGGIENIYFGCNPWSIGSDSGRVIKIHFNYFSSGLEPEDVPSPLPIDISASGISEWPGVQHLTPSNNRNQKATTSDPWIAIHFNNDGTLKRVEIGQ